MKLELTVHMLEQDPERCALTLHLVARRLAELEALPIASKLLLEFLARALGEESPFEEWLRLRFARELLEAALTWYQART
jgi:hypothetical protein